MIAQRLTEYIGGLLDDAGEWDDVNQPAFLVLNGIQTQSAGGYNLVHALPEIDALGVNIVRISPQAEQTDAVVGLFDDVRRNKVTVQTAFEAMKGCMPGAPCNKRRTRRQCGHSLLLPDISAPA